ncbi:MAG TPA: thioredoxin family protein [Acidimicrobiales bacterium]|nr:thioredoxin family protein [Acidimicrobiales bacterium]
MSETTELVEATRENFADLTAAGTVLVDVWGPDCRPCLALLPAVEALAAKHAGDLQVIKLEAPKARRLCMQLSIMGMPAFLLFRDGKEVARLSDPALTPLALNQWVNEQMKEVS